MANIAKSSPAHSGRKPNPRAAKAKADTKEPSIAVPASLLLDVQDDLLELADILHGLPGLRQLHATLRGDRHSTNCMDNADLIDLGAAPDVILGAVQCRLNRIAAFLAAL